MKRFLAISAVLSLLVLPVMVSADNDQPPMPRETKWSSEPAASVPAENTQKQRVESTSQVTDATVSSRQTNGLQRSIEQYEAVNPSTNSD
jgi:hypothetical protein